jgi:hypothetical protein
MQGSIKKMEFGKNSKMNGRIQWHNILQTPEEWQTAMGRNGEYGDDVLLQIASNVLHRRIEIAPLLGNRTITIGPEHTQHPTISLLYFSETRFHSPHYQSMTPEL